MVEQNEMTLGYYFESYPAVAGKKIADVKSTTYRILNSTVREMFSEYHVGDEKMVDLRRYAWFYNFDRDGCRRREDNRWICLSFQVEGESGLHGR